MIIYTGKNVSVCAVLEHLVHQVRVATTRCTIVVPYPLYSVKIRVFFPKRKVR